MTFATTGYIQFGTTGFDLTQGISADSSGNIYVTGSTQGSLSGNSNLGSDDAFVAKYDGSGNQVWVKQFGSSNSDSGTGISTDSSGNIYVTGFTDGSLPGNSNLGNTDAFVAKYDEIGNQVWVKQFGSSGFDFASGISANSSGNIYVTGSTDDSLLGNSNLGSSDTFVAKYDEIGNQVWVKQFGSSGFDYVQGISTDSSGNIYVTGYTFGSLPGNSNLGSGDAFVAKYDGSGNQIWVKQFGSSGFDYVQGISTDSSGHIYVTGYTFGSLPGYSNLGSSDAFVAKYDEIGNQIWVKQFGTSDYDYVQGINTNSGHVYVTGNTDGSLPGNSNLGSRDAFVAGFDVNGNLLAPATLAINNVTLTEGNNGNKIATFTVTRTGIATDTITVNYATADSTAIAGIDYTATDGILTFATNETTKTITVAILGDTIFEADETFFVYLTNAINATITDPQGLGTITDEPIITLAVDPNSVTEDGTNNLVYTFTRTGDLTNSLVVNYNISGTATNGTDYTQIGAASFDGTTGSVTFAANSTTATVIISPTADTIVEPDETIALTLASSIGYTLETNTAVTGTITNDETNNDNFANRTILTGTNITTTGFNLGFTGETGEAIQSETINSAWWSWTATTSTPVTIDTIGSNFDTYLSVFTGNGVNALTFVTNDDDSGGNLTSKVIFTPTAGTSYQIAVDGFDSSTGNIVFNLNPIPNTLDFNSDGNRDLLWQNSLSGAVGYWYMDNTNQLSSVGISTVPLDWKLVGTGDFNQDNKDDLLWHNTDTGQVGYWYMDNTTILGGAIVGAAKGWNLVGTGDFNQDSKDDLLWQNPTTGEVGYWYMDNTNQLSSVIIATVSLDWTLVGTGDFNQDSKDDLLWQNSLTGTVGYWYMDNTNQLSSVIIATVSLDWKLMGTGDFNQDSKDDLLWQNPSNGEVGYWYMDNTTFLGAAIAGSAQGWNVL